MPEFSILETEESNQPETCGGLFFRCSQESWIGSDLDVNYCFRFRYLKGKSCVGCMQCDWLWENLDQDISNLPFGFHGPEPEYNKLQPGALYQYKVTGYSTDWETGICDDVDVEFVLVEEK